MARKTVQAEIELQNQIFDVQIHMDDMVDVGWRETRDRNNRKGWVGVVYSGNTDSDLLGSEVQRPWLFSEDEANPELLAKYKVKYAEWYAYNRKDIDTKRIILAKAVQAGLIDLDIEDLKWSGNDGHFKTTKRGMDIWVSVAPLGYFADLEIQIEAQRVAGEAAKAESIRKALEIFGLAPEIEKIMVRVEGWSSPFWYTRQEIAALDENGAI
jgi:hypothetical protein